MLSKKFTNSNCLQDIIPKENSNSVNGFAALAHPVVELFVPQHRIAAVKSEAESLPSVELSQLDLQWVQVLSEGWASPLRGFMREDDYLDCMHKSVITRDGVATNQSVPIVLAVTDLQKCSFGDSSTAIGLKYEGQVVAVLRDIEVYRHRKEERVCLQFGTSEPEHPCIKVINKIRLFFCENKPNKIHFILCQFHEKSG